MRTTTIALVSVELVVKVFETPLVFLVFVQLQPQDDQVKRARNFLIIRGVKISDSVQLTSVYCVSVSLGG